MFRRLTKQQRVTLEAIRCLGGQMIVDHITARPLHALKRRGLVRFHRDAHGVKLASLRENKRQRRRRHKLDRLYLPMHATGWLPAITNP